MLYLNRSIETFGRAACHINSVVGVTDRQIAAGQFDCDVSVLFAITVFDSRDSRRAGAGPAGLHFTHSALPDAHHH